MFGLAWHTAVLVFGLVALAPVRFGDLAPHPRPVATYQAAVARIAATQSIEEKFVAASGRSILLTHGRRTPRVVVLFHGMTDSPQQFSSFAHELFDAGDNVYVPRLPHHAELAGNVRTMGLLTARELRDFGDVAIDVAQSLGDTLVVAGLSAGGTVAAWTVQYRPEVRRAVLIAPAISMTKVPSVLRGAVLRIALRAPNVVRSSPRDSSELDRIPGWATHAFAQMLILADVVRGASGSHAAHATDVALLLNANDHTVSNAAALDLARNWSDHGARVRVAELPASMRLPHEIIDPRHTGSDTTAVYPVLHALFDGSALPAWATDLSTSVRPLPRTLASSSPVLRSASPAQ